MSRVLFLSLLLCAIPLTPVLVQERASNHRASVRAIERVYRKIPSGLKFLGAETKAIDEAYEKLRKSRGVKKADAFRAKQRAKVHSLRSKTQKAYQDLKRCFLAKKGVDLVSRDSSKAMQVSLRIVAGVLYDEGSMREAARHYEKALELSTNPESDLFWRIEKLPLCYLDLGQPDKALAACEAALPLLEDSKKGIAQHHLGIIYSIIGDLESAKKQWNLVVEGGGNFRGTADRSLKRLGTEALDLTQATWIGGKKKPFEKLRCKAAIIAFLSTSNTMSRRMMSVLDEYHDAFDKSDLRVFGVVKYEGRGYLPDRKYPKEFGQEVNGIQRRGCEDYLKQFRSNLQLGYPLLIGSQADATHYGLRFKGDFVVLDSSGRVVMIANGMAGLPFAKAMVKRLIAEAGR